MLCLQLPYPPRSRIRCLRIPRARANTADKHFIIATSGRLSGEAKAHQTGHLDKNTKQNPEKPEKHKIRRKYKKNRKYKKYKTEYNTVNSCVCIVTTQHYERYLLYAA